MATRQLSVTVTVNLALIAAVVVVGGGSSQIAKATEPALSETHLASVAEDTISGEFTPLNGTRPPEFDSFAEFHTHGTAADPDTWNARGQWDPKRKRTFFFGDRHRNVFHSYDAVENRWHHNALAEEIPTAGHQWGTVGLDVDQGYFYRAAQRRLFRYRIDEDRWELASDSYPGQHFSPMEFHEGLGRLLALGDEQLYAFRGGEWQPEARVRHRSQHANMIYNRAREEMLIVGGRRSERRVSLLTADGQLHEMDDLPFNWATQHHCIGYDPESGNYLALHRKTYQLWEYDPSRDTWRKAADWKEENQEEWRFGSFFGHVLIPIDELGVILWMHRSGPVVYRHSSAFSDVSPSNPIADTSRSAQRSTSSPPQKEGAAPSPTEEQLHSAKQVATEHQSTVAAPPSALAQTELGQHAANLAPGRFVSLESSPPAGVARLREMFLVQSPDGRRGRIDAWADGGHWDSQRRQTLFHGLGGVNKFITYRADENRWEELGWEGTPPPDQDPERYIYSRTAFDATRGHYYRLSGEALYRYEIEEARWSRLGETPIGGNTPIEWHQALDMLISVKEGVVRGFEGERWQELGTAGVSGDRSSAQYNPVRQELLVIGGDGSEQAVSILDADGEVSEASDVPFAFQMSLDHITYDPQSGKYLVLRWDERTLWEYDADADHWRPAWEWSSDGWPFHEYGTVVPIPIDELGIIFWQYEHGPRLYRHRLASDTASADSTQAASRLSRSRAAPGGDLSKPKASPEVPEPGVEVEQQPHEALAALGEDMAPGEWRYIETKNTPRFRVGSCRGDPGDGGTHALGWTGSFAYDPETQSFWAIGMRGGSEKRLFVLDRDLEWNTVRQLPLDECLDDRRPFNRLSLVDGYLYWPSSNTKEGGGRSTRGHLLRAPIEPYLEGDTDVKWERVSRGLGISNMNGTGDFAVAWYPDLGGWVFVGRRSGTKEPTPFSQEGHTEEGQALGKRWYARAMFLRPPNPEWLQFDVLYSGQYQGQLLYNPIKQQMLVAPGIEFGNQPEGSEPRREWAIIHHDGGDSGLVNHSDEGPTPWVEKIDRAVGDGFEPPPFSPRYGTIGYDPVSGDYLWWNRQHDAIWRSPDGKHWHVYEGFEDLSDARFPEGLERFRGRRGLFGATGYVQMNAVPGTDLVVFFDPDRGLILHRMKDGQAYSTR